MSGWDEIVVLYILPDYFGKGIAERLFGTAIKKICHMGFERQYLWVLTDNARARKFYEKNGFCNSGETREIVIAGRALLESKYVNEIDCLTE